MRCLQKTKKTTTKEGRAQQSRAAYYYYYYCYYYPSEGRQAGCAASLWLGKKNKVPLQHIGRSLGRSSSRFRRLVLLLVDNKRKENEKKEEGKNNNLLLLLLLLSLKWGGYNVLLLLLKKTSEMKWNWRNEVKKRKDDDNVQMADRPTDSSPPRFPSTNQKDFSECWTTANRAASRVRDDSSSSSTSASCSEWEKRNRLVMKNENHTRPDCCWPCLALPFFYCSLIAMRLLFCLIIRNLIS